MVPYFYYFVKSSLTFFIMLKLNFVRKDLTKFIFYDKVALVHNTKKLIKSQ